MKKRGIVKIDSQKGRLRIRFPIALFDGIRKEKMLGLDDTPENWVIAEKLAEQANQDIKDNDFDYSLKRYSIKFQNQKKNIKIVEIWNQYCKYKRPSVKKSTYLYWTKTIQPWIEKNPYQSPKEALEFRNWLLPRTTEGMTRRILGQVSKVCNWAIKHGLIEHNRFEGMASEFKIQKSKADPFTPKQKEHILNGFELSEHYSYYLPLVKFLFLTGCRPSEAIGLYWSDVKRKYIHFDGGLTYTNGQLVNTKGQGSKNGTDREFPINPKLQGFLNRLPRCSPLVFPSPSGKPINYNNFSNRAWEAIAPIDSTPYQCRDTFISEQIGQGIPSAIVALWVDNSIGTIEKHYLGNSQSILPV